MFKKCRILLQLLAEYNLTLIINDQTRIKKMKNIMELIGYEDFVK